MSIEKIDLHYHQQLSALIDGELAPDQARFLLRRMEHDSELRGCVERWQVLGDALRGQARAPAPEGFAERVAAAVACEPARAAAAPASRGKVALWGGGALAASVAAIALFVSGQQVPRGAPSSASPAVASQSAVAPAPAPQVAPQADLAPNAAAEAVAAVRPQAGSGARRSATRTRQAARSTALAAQVPRRAVVNAPLPGIQSIAVAPQPPLNSNPFADVRVDGPSARPWPRGVLPQYPGGGFNADYSGQGSSRAFYPFEPRLPAAQPLAPSATGQGQDP